MHFCLRQFLRFFPHGGSSFTGTVSIPLFLIPSIASRAPSGAYRSYPQQDYGHDRLLTTGPTGHRTLSFAAEGSSTISCYWGDVSDRSTVGERLGRALQATTPLRLQDEVLYGMTGKPGWSGESDALVETAGHHEQGQQSSACGGGIGPKESIKLDRQDRCHFPPVSVRDDPNRWIAQMEASLPVRLRARGADMSRNSPLSIVGLVDTLKQARMLHNVDILSHLGVHGGRWQAVIWIVRKALDSSPISHGYAFDALPVEYNQMTTEIPTLCRGKRADELARNEALGQIWSSLGSMIIAASERSAEERKHIMSHVLQIIAYIHHNDRVPNSLYNYTHTNQPSNHSLFQRPPTLHLLSSRILTSLSDAVWRAHEQHIAAEAAAVGVQYTYMGHDVPGARYKLKVRELGPEVWMELILWCCVEAGFITEGAWIIRELEKRPSIYRWSVMSWNSIQHSGASGPGQQASAVDWDRVKRRTGGVVGRIEGYSAERPFVEAGERTISSEVVVALVDGLVNAILVSDPRQGHSSMRIFDLIIILKGILDREPYGNGTLPCDQFISCILNAAGPQAQTNPKLLERVLNLAPDQGARGWALHPQNREPGNCNGAGRDTGHSAITGYVLHRLLGLYARSGHINACLRVWSRLQDLMDSAKLMAIEDFFARLKSCSAAGDEDMYFGQKPLDYLKPHFHYRIPGPILADFLSVVTENREFEFGRWLLYSRDVDGPVIPESTYSNVFLAPLLVNFASATSDMELLSKVISKVSRPFSTDMVKALLRCEIDLQKWDGVEDILGFIHSRRKYRWTELELAKLLVAILTLERDMSKAVTNVELLAKAASLKRAKTILGKLMNGNFGKPKPLKKHYWPGNKYMNLLRYMVHTTLPSHIDIQHDILDGWKPEDTRFLATTTFNTLLKGIVETQGSERGRHIWELWCRPPESTDVDTGFGLQMIPSSRFPAFEHGDESVVFEGSSRRLGAAQLDLLYMSGRVKQIRRLERGWIGKGLRPNIGTLRTIIQGALKERVGVTAESNLDSIFAWGKEMFRRFGLDEREIDRELGVATDTSDM